MEAMAAVVNRNPLEIEAARVSANNIALLNYDGVRLTAAGQLPGRSNPGRTSA
jgi:hypothetical protein